MRQPPFGFIDALLISLAMWWIAIFLAVQLSECTDTQFLQ